jgi:hypothetical protein
MNVERIKKSINNQSTYLKERIQARKNNYIHMKSGYGTNCSLNYSLIGDYDLDEDNQLTIIPIPNYIYSSPRNMTPDIENQITQFEKDSYIETNWKNKFWTQYFNHGPLNLLKLSMFMIMARHRNMYIDNSNIVDTVRYTLTSNPKEADYGTMYKVNKFWNDYKCKIITASTILAGSIFGITMLSLRHYEKKHRL